MSFWFHRCKIAKFCTFFVEEDTGNLPASLEPAVVFRVFFRRVFRPVFSFLPHYMSRFCYSFLPSRRSSASVLVSRLLTNFIQQPKAPGYLLQSNLHGSIVLSLACEFSCFNVFWSFLAKDAIFFCKKIFLFQPVFGTRSHWKTIVTHRSRNRSWRCSPSFCCCSWAITTVTWKIPCEKHFLASAIPKVRSVIFPLFILGNESDAEGSHHLDWLIDWLSNSIVDRSFHWLIDWSICCSIDWSIDWLMGWFPFLDFLFGRLIDWSIC